MTLLKFSKTRIVYWDSYRSTLTLPANANTLPTEVSKVDVGDDLPYLVYRIRGTDASNIGHNWHNIPYNAYGLYCTPAEINSLYENSNSITPKSCGFVVGHTIPLNRNATSNSTQLSFNNTIYSLIVDMPGNDMVTCGWEDDVISKFNIFIRTFDGSTYDTLKRNVLPRNDIIFKVPKVKTNGTFQPTQGGALSDTKALYKDFENFTGTDTFGLINGLTQNCVVNAYLPEILQDNSNVKTLYPGENQDMFHLDLKQFEPLSTIPCSQINFNECWNNQDARSQWLNSNLAFPGDVLTVMSLVPVSRGVEDTFEFGTDQPFNDFPYGTDFSDTGTGNLGKFQQMLWSEIIQSKNGMKHMDTYTSNLPTKFIKCLPIMSQDDTPVTHTICGTVTWTLEVEVTDRLHKEINPYKWDMVWPFRYIQRTFNDAKKYTGVKTYETMISSQGMRPLNDSHYKNLQVRRRAHRDNDPGKRINYPYRSTNNYTPALADTTANLGRYTNSIPYDTEQPPGLYTPACVNHNPTATFGAQTGARLTRSQTKKLKSSASR